MGPQPVDEGKPLGNNFCAELDELVVPDVERRELLGAEPLLPARFQQRIALAQHPLVLRDRFAEPRGVRYEELVKQLPALTRVAAHER